MTSPFNYHEFPGNREEFLEHEVWRLEAELHQREQDYADLLKEAKEVCEIQVEFQNSTDKIMESKDQEIASLARELKRKAKELEEMAQRLDDAMSTSSDGGCGGVNTDIFNAERQGGDSELDRRGDDD